MDPAIHLGLRTLLALLFGAAAFHKLRDVRGFREALAAYGLLFAWLVRPAALLLPVVEASVAAALMLPGARVAGPVGAAALLLLYALAMAVNLARGRYDLDCGCAGPAARRPISGWLVARNVGLAALALLALAPVRLRTLGWLDAVTIIAALATCAALHAAVDELLSHAPAIARARGEV